MRTIVSALLAFATLFGLATSARATDLMNVVTPAPMVYGVDSPLEGFYLGKFFGAEICGQCAPNWEVGKAFGYNWITDGGFVLGVEGRVSVYTWDGDLFDFGSAFGFARAGFLLGDNVMLYKIGGLGFFFDSSGSSDLFYRIGAGVEVAATDNLSIRADVTHLDCVAGPCAPGVNVIEGGFVFHFH